MKSPHHQHHDHHHPLVAYASSALVLALTCCVYSWARPPPTADEPRFLLPDSARHPHNNHLVICSRELERLTVGGAGVVIADTARALTLSGRWRVTLLLDLAPQPPFLAGAAQHANNRHRLQAWLVDAASAWARVDNSGVNGGFQRIDESRRQSVLNNLRVMLLEDLLPRHRHQQGSMLLNASSSSLPHHWRNSMLWAHGLQALYAKDPFDAVEFFDYEAPAYHTLLGRLVSGGGGGDDDVATVSRPFPFHVWIRTHGLLQSIDDVESSDRQEEPEQQQQQHQQQQQQHWHTTQGGSLHQPPPHAIDQLNYVYRMETRALQLADAVIANSPAIGELYARKQNLSKHRIIAIPPTLGTLEAYDAMSSSTSSSSSSSPSLPPPPPTRGAKQLDDSTTADSTTPTTTNILVYGKLQRVKGADVAARAIVQVMQSKEWPHGMAIFAGDDVPCASDPTVNSSTCILRSIVPEDLRSRFHFTGAVQRGEIGAIATANHVRLAILPSRYETFCLAAHEVKHYGVPVVLPDLPAYRDYFVDGVNALLFEPGSAEDLARVLARAVANDALVSSLRAAPQFQYDDPAKGYARLIGI